MNQIGEFDVAVIGAGHAGIEAALASAKRGCRTALFTISLDQVGNMPCNPSVGGTAKGHLVREIDALGGAMGEAGDACCIQMRMLNLSKGVSVQSPRAQCDRRKYARYMKRRIEQTAGLSLIQTEIADIVLDDNGCVKGVVNAFGGFYACRAAVICCGTFLHGKIYIGKHCEDGGPDAVQPARYLSESLERAGVTLRRFKTGTPCRVHRRSIDFSKLQVQHGDPDPQPFSFAEDAAVWKNDAECFIAYSNDRTHRIIHENLTESPLYGGMIDGIGPRYCPSIEDKVVRFPARERHQIFVEPVGSETDELYLQGFSTSLPEYVQQQMLRSVAGFEHIEVMRSAYAIEYDCINPLALYHSLEFRAIGGLFSAGQFNGTSGYEEAAAQGIVAGINASAYVLNQKPLLLPRSSSYIGTLIDDLVTKGTDDPYRMMTARSEYRLSLRHGNADARLTAIGREFGMISDSRWRAFESKMTRISDAIAEIRARKLSPDAVNAYLSDIETSEVTQTVSAGDLLRRPQVVLTDFAKRFGLCQSLSRPELEEVSAQIKYEEYIQRQNQQNERFAHLEHIRLPQNTDYSKIRGLSSEAAEKLSKLRPDNLSQASRISGISPADTAILLTWLKAGGVHD